MTLVGFLSNFGWKQQPQYQIHKAYRNQLSCNVNARANTENHKMCHCMLIWPSVFQLDSNRIRNVKWVWFIIKYSIHIPPWNMDRIDISVNDKNYNYKNNTNEWMNEIIRSVLIIHNNEITKLHWMVFVRLFMCRQLIIYGDCKWLPFRYTIFSFAIIFIRLFAHAAIANAVAAVVFFFYSILF